MTANRRNFYRLLHVQADAPAEVIRASYRALMALHHPDKGGDHAVAVLVNEAYAVLSDPARRAAYDARRTTRANACTMCRLPYRGRPASDASCTRCSAPLGLPPRSRAQTTPGERRGWPRVSKTQWARLHVEWPSEPVDIRMRDVSLDGISVYSGAALSVGSAVRVVCETIDAVGEVVSCRRIGAVFILHARLVSAQFMEPRGAFLSTMA